MVCDVMVLVNADVLRAGPLRIYIPRVILELSFFLLW
jgi:hypothetical protein